MKKSILGLMVAMACLFAGNATSSVEKNSKLALEHFNNGVYLTNNKMDFASVDEFRKAHEYGYEFSEEAIRHFIRVLKYNAECDEAKEIIKKYTSKFPRVILEREKASMDYCYSSMNEVKERKRRFFEKQEERVRLKKEKEEKHANLIANQYAEFMKEQEPLIKEYGKTNKTKIMHNGLEYNVIISPFSERAWLDRNIGAKRVCIDYNDAQCFGDYFQFGRGADGHEKVNSSIVTGQSPTYTPTVKHLIYGYKNWTRDKTPLWVAPDYINNPCPSGFKVPSMVDLEIELKGNEFFTNLKAFESVFRFGGSGFREKHKITTAVTDRNGNARSKYIYLASSSSDSFNYGKYYQIGRNLVDYRTLKTKGIPVRCVEK